MVNGRQSSIDVWHGRSTPTCRTIDHHDGNAECARGFYLGIGRHPAGILGHDVRDTVFRKQGKLVLHCERPSGRDVMRARHLKWRLYGVHAADEIIMMRGSFEGQKLLTSEGQESPCSIRPESRDSTLDIANALPDVIRLPLPGGPFKRNQRNLCQLSGLNGICGDAGRVGMRRVHQKVKPVLTDKARQTAGTTKATRAHRHRLGDGFAGASGHGQQNAIVRIFSQPASQNAGIRRAAENKYGACHGL